MPRKSEWIHKLPSILQGLEELPSDLVDRCVVEQLWGVSSRQAARILRKFGAERAGGALFLFREDLHKRLWELQHSEAVVFEQSRAARFRQRLEEERATVAERNIQIPVPAQKRVLGLEHLPPEIELEAKEVRIRYSTPVELLQHLLLLAQTLGEDWDRFSR